MKNNLELWEKFKETPPNFTKNFKKGGGFSGTSINSTYITKSLTEQFGPWGKGWGWAILEEKYIEGGPLFVDKLEAGREVIHVIRISLWYEQRIYNTPTPSEDDIFETRRVDCPPHFGQTTFVGTNKNGVFTDEEAPKKSITDAVTKSASMLGLGADVFSGLYDDNKYVNDLREKHGEGKAGGNGSKPATKMDEVRQAAERTANGGGARDLTGDPKKVLDQCLEDFCGNNPVKRKSKLMVLGHKAGLLPATLNAIKGLGDLSDQEAALIVEKNKESLAIPF